jgi:hypothetical protein
MMSHIVPGRSLPLTGGVTYFSVGLGANITNATTTPEGPVSFEVTIHSDSEAQANVSLRAATLLPANWTLRTDRALYYILPGETQSASVTITPAANTSNGTRRITIIGDYKDEPGANRTTENTITFSIVIQGGAPPPGEGPGPSGPATISPYVLYAGLGAAAVVGAVLWFVVWPLLHASRARDRFNRVSQSSWARSPRRGPSGGAPRPMLRAPGMAPGQPPSGAPRPPLR